MKNIPDAFLTTPIVYVVRNTYQIMVPVSCETVMWAEVGGKYYYDDSNGILRSDVTTHRISVPASVLDREKKYKILFRRIKERKPYFTDAGEVEEYVSSFRPVTGGTVRMYHIADAHNRVEEPVAAGKFFGDGLDVLILNGDIPNHSGEIQNFTAIHNIASQLTNGEIPVIFSRGNHDMRGIYAEKIAEHTPTDNGKSYYSFRLGHIWGIVLDCGEDKPDENAEYGHTICCEDFRRRETEYLWSVIADSKNEYEADGVEHRIVIVHNPFTQIFNAPFDIEKETYTLWARLLRDYVKPEIMICGHVHKCYISNIGSERDNIGQPCPVVAASRPQKNAPFFGGAFTLYPDRCNVKFTGSDGSVAEDVDIMY
jgi:Icc-related predicted phosphoesterase